MNYKHVWILWWTNFFFLKEKSLIASYFCSNNTLEISWHIQRCGPDSDLFFCLRLAQQLRDEVQTDVHGGDPSHHQGQKFTGVALWNKDTQTPAPFPSFSSSLPCLLQFSRDRNSLRQHWRLTQGPRSISQPSPSFSSSLLCLLQFSKAEVQ